MFEFVDSQCSYKVEEIYSLNKRDLLFVGESDCPFTYSAVFSSCGRIFLNSKRF